MAATLDLKYEGKWWVLLPNSFPAGDDSSLSEWSQRVALQYQAQPPWDAPPFDAVLPQYLAEQFVAIDSRRSAALWFCPSGLPADAYVHITLTDDTNAEETSYEQIVGRLTSQLDFTMEHVATKNLGAGVAFARIRAGKSDGQKTLPSYGETTYLFHPPGYLLVISARSADPRMIGLMSQGLWDIIESITIND